MFDRESVAVGLFKFRYNDRVERRLRVIYDLNFLRAYKQVFTPSIRPNKYHVTVINLLDIETNDGFVSYTQRDETVLSDFAHFFFFFCYFINTVYDAFRRRVDLVEK